MSVDFGAVFPCRNAGYLTFMKKMAMFHNTVHPFNHTPDENPPVMDGVAPDRYLPQMKVIEVMCGSITRLNKVHENEDMAPQPEQPVNDSIPACASRAGVNPAGFTPLDPAWLFPASRVGTCLLNKRSRSRSPLFFESMLRMFGTR